MFLIELLAAATLQIATDPSSLSPQALFDQATAATVSGECAKAVDLFSALEQRHILKAGSLPASASAVRKGYCLVRLQRVTEGERAIRQGLPVLEKAGPEFDHDVADARYMLGLGAAGYQDYDSAVSDFKRSLALRTGFDRLQTLAKLADVTTFDGDQASLSYSQEAIGLITALPDKEQNKDSLSVLHALHARALLNRGNIQEGYAELKQALALSGGLTSRTTIDEASMRADLAMAAALAGHKDEARKYLAYTGAGILSNGERFQRGQSMDPPVCGEETGLRPEDVAVVEFQIGDNGTVSNARTAYTRGNRAVAAAFARAVNDWYWLPESVKAIPIFYRANTRLEIRCSMTGARAPSVMAPASARFYDWASSQLPAVDGKGLRRVENLRTWLSQNATNASPMQRVAVLGSIASSTIGPAATLKDDANAAVAAAHEAQAPIEVENWLKILVAMREDDRSDRITRTNLRTLAASPSFADDPLAKATALLASTQKSRGGTLPEAPAILQQVADENRLPQYHPLRQAARLSLANIASTADDGASAQRYFAATGLTEQQCALIGIHPALRSSGASSDSYPAEALRMGFEGWVNLEFDVSADGRAIGTRAIVAYPPLIFVDAATDMSRNFRYQASYRPGGGAACSANREIVNFIRSW